MQAGSLPGITYPLDYPHSRQDVQVMMGQKGDYLTHPHSPEESPPTAGRMCR